MREEFFFGLELRGMNAAAAAAQLHRMFKVQHFVINDVLDGVAGNAWVIEDTAYNDCIMGRVVVPEAVAGMVAAPGHRGSGKQAVEESSVQVVEDILQIVSPALGTFDSLAATDLAHKMSFSGDVLTGNIAAIPNRIPSLDGPAIHFGQKNVSDRPQHRVRRAFHTIRNAKTSAASSGMGARGRSSR